MKKNIGLIAFFILLIMAVIVIQRCLGHTAGRSGASRHPFDGDSAGKPRCERQ